jgi:uncharacterized protein YggE
MNKAALWLALATTVSLSSLHAQTIQVDKNNRTLAVTATGTASAPADTAIVTIGFQIYAPDAESAYRQGSQLSNAILDAVKKQGIEDDSIESREQNLTRNNFPDDRATLAERAQRQFTLSQSWAVHASAKDAANILHAAIEAGANQSGNIEWDLADRNPIQGEAAEKALVRAHAIAARMAAGLEVHLGPLIYASNQAPAPPIRPMMAAAFGAKRSGGPTPLPLALRPRKVEESATVYAVFSID